MNNNHSPLRYLTNAGEPNRLPDNGQWTCYKCFINNFNGRANCFKCGTLRARGEAFALDAKGLTMVGTLPCDTLLIRELPASADDLSVRHAVVRFTDVEPLSVRLAASRMFAFIQMGSLFDAEMAHHKLQRTCLYIDNCAVFVSFSRHPLTKVLSEGRIKLLPEMQQDVQIIDQTPHNQSSSSSTSNSVNTPFGILPIFAEPDPTKFQYEHSSGYFYDPATCFYHDPKTEFYYSAKSRSWKFWCRKYRTYIDCEGGDVELKRRLQEDEREQGDVGQTLVDGPPPSEAQHRHALRHAPPPPNPPGGGGGGSINKVSSTPATLRSTNGNNSNNNKRPRPPLLELESDDDDIVIENANAMQPRDAIGRAMPRHEGPRKRLGEEENGNGGGGEQQRIPRPPPKQRFVALAEEEKVMTTPISREDLGQLVSALVKRGIDEEWRNLRNKRRSSRSRSRSPPPRHGSSSSKRDEHWRDGGGGGRENDRSPLRHGSSSKRDEHWRGDGRESDRQPSRRRDESRSSRDTSRERRRTHEFRQHQHQLLQQDQEPMTICSSPSPPPPAVVPFEGLQQHGCGVPSSSSSRAPIPAPMFASSPVPPQPRGSPFLATAPVENSPFMLFSHHMLSPTMFPPFQMPPHNLPMMLQHGGGGGQPPFNNNNNSPMFVPRMPTPSSLGLRFERAAASAAAAAMQMGTTPGVPRGYVGPPSSSSSAGPKLFLNNTLRGQQLRYPAALSSAGASRALPSSAFGGGLPGTFPSSSSSGNRRGAAPPSKASVVNQLDVDQQQKKSQLISKERDKVNSLGICLNCGRHGHNLFQCRWERISDDELQKKLRDAKQKQQRQELDKQELKRRADKHPLRRKDPLIERLRVTAPHGKIKMEYIRTICQKCAYFNHTRMECSRADIGRILHKQICNQLEEFKKVFFVHLLEDRMVDLSQKFDTFRVMDGIELNGTIDPVGLQLQAMCPDGIVTQMDLRELCSNCAMLGHKRTECKEKTECSRTHYDKMLELVKGYRALVKEGNGNFVLPTAKMMNPPVLVLKDIERSEPIEEIILLDSSDDEEEETEKQGKEKETQREEKEMQLGEEEKEKQQEEEEKEKQQKEEEKKQEEKDVEEIIMLDSNDDEAMEKEGEEKEEKEKQLGDEEKTEEEKEMQGEEKEKQLEDKEKPEEEKKAQGEQNEEKETQREKEKQLGEKEMQIDELIVLDSDDEEKEKQGEEKEETQREKLEEKEKQFEDREMPEEEKKKQAEEKETQGEEKEKEEEEMQLDEEVKKKQQEEKEKKQTEKDVEEIIMLDSNDDEEIEKEGADKEKQEEEKKTQGEEKETQGEEKEKQSEEKETQGEEKEKQPEEKEKQSEEEEKTEEMEKQQEGKEMQVEEVIMVDSNDNEAMKKQGEEKEEKEKQLGDEEKTEEEKETQGEKKEKQLENDEKREEEKETQGEEKEKEK
ncbi:hypothetical protein niasHS_000779 [Heterodera schachtii]|uniref:RanBP2-type domain-containing protein n=1 Tax=Heterodera schachtii TaxID=97005 RepID=A0ABD2KIX4_HETSC